MSVLTGRVNGRRVKRSRVSLFVVKDQIVPGRGTGRRTGVAATFVAGFEGLERLCRYGLRVPFAQHRLSMLAGGVDMLLVALGAPRGCSGRWMGQR